MASPPVERVVLGERCISPHTSKSFIATISDGGRSKPSQLACYAGLEPSGNHSSYPSHLYATYGNSTPAGGAMHNLLTFSATYAGIASNDTTSHN